jgi:hypothetical protein
MRGLFFTLIAISLVAPALTNGQSLGEIARKEAARRAKNKEQGVAAPKIGNEELNQAREAREKEAGEESVEASAAPETTPLTSHETVPPRDESERRRQQESAWRKRATQAEERVAAAKRQYEKLQSMWLIPGRRYVDHQGRLVITTPEQLQAMTARAKQELEAAEKALKDLHESARREGVPPGWLR